jgi:hypothetical protein
MIGLEPVYLTRELPASLTVVFWPGYGYFLIFPLVVLTATTSVGQPLCAPGVAHNHLRGRGSYSYAHPACGIVSSP